MAKKTIKISQLGTMPGSVAGTEIIQIIFADTSYNITVSELMKYLNPTFDAKEDDLGKPSKVGQVLASDIHGNRSWVDQSGGITPVLTTTVFEFIATASQTVFIGADKNGNDLVLSTTGTNVSVHKNGLLLFLEDYTINDVNTITMVDALNLDEEITITEIKIG